MGLLSDPESVPGKWVKILMKIHHPLSILLCIGAVAWFFLLGNRSFNNSTYFSENALLPGLVRSDFNEERSAKQYYTELLEEMEDKYTNRDEIPVPWLVGKMSQLHLEVYTHNYTLRYPMGEGQRYKGTNVYGILRATRTSSLEALVVSAPYRPLSSHQKGTAAGIALMLAMAKFARPQKYWAKDIIFLVTEHEQLGMQAWLEAYHGLEGHVETFYTDLGPFWAAEVPKIGIKKPFSSVWKLIGDGKKCLNPGKLQGRSGAIQAAINLEFHTPQIKYVEVKIEGLNGQLPNLDLVNLVNKMLVKSGIHHSFKNSYSWVRNRNENAEWINNIWTLLGMVSSQLAGVPNGNHGLFHRFGIESVTLEGREAVDPAGTPPKVHTLSSCNAYRLGVALEGVLRSLNNLLERFHQSYFFYLMASTDRFVSIGQYMPSLCLICLAFLIRALAMWVSLQNEDDIPKNKGTQTTPEKLKQQEKHLLEEKPTTADLDNSDNENKLRHRAHAIKKTDQDSKKSEDDSEKTDNDSKKSDRDSKKSDDDSEKSDHDSKKSEHDSKKSKHYSKKSIAKKNYKGNLSTFNIGTNYLLVHMIGYAVMNTPVMFSRIGSKFFDLSNENAIFHGLAITSIFLIVTTPFLPKLLRNTLISMEEVILVNIVVLIELATACLCVGMHNFSTALVLALFYSPLALSCAVLNKKNRFIRKFFIQIICLLTHPLLLLSISMIVTSKYLFPEESMYGAISRGLDAAKQGLMFSVVDSAIYGNWLFNVATCLILPIWTIFWQISCISVE